MTAPVLPGQTIGIVGGGQLGRMLAMVARRQGYRVQVLTPEADSPASPFANVVTRAADDDLAAWSRFAAAVDVVTLEFENVPADSLELIAARVPVRPGLNVLRTCQNRASEKAFLRAAGIPCAPFARIEAAGQIAAAWATVSGPAVLKTSDGGYDGKGQSVVTSEAQLRSTWQGWGGPACTLEALIDLDCEFSVLVARDCFGTIRTYDPIRNLHSNHILDLSVSPAGLPSQVMEQACELARRIALELDLVGLVCVEFFLARDGSVLANEIAPRPHNSGHLTIEAHACSQFEQQLRCVCGLPAGPTRQLRPAAMANLLGDLWSTGTPAWERLAAFEECRLHLYDKSEPRAGRKMGHMTVCADDPQTARERALAARLAMVAGPALEPFLSSSGPDRDPSASS